MSDWDAWWKAKRVDGTLFQRVKRITTAGKVAMILNLLDGLVRDAPAILELGAGSGMTTVSLVERLGGSGVLVDAAPEAREYFRHMYGEHPAVTYYVDDVTRFVTDIRFDLVFSDGVLSLLQGDVFERFMARHVAYLKPDGLVLIIVARNSAYIRMRDRLLGSEFLYIFLLKWFGISKPSYEYEKLYADDELVDLCQEWGLEVLRSKRTYKTVCVLCRKTPMPA